MAKLQVSRRTLLQLFQIALLLLILWKANSLFSHRSEQQENLQKEVDNLKKAVEDLKTEVAETKKNSETARMVAIHAIAQSRHALNEVANQKKPPENREEIEE